GHFEPTPLGKILHIALKALGGTCFFCAIPPIAFLLSQRAKCTMGPYRWLLLAITVSGASKDIMISLCISPYTLVPHISFWADGLLVYLHPRAILYCLAVVLALMYLWLTSILIAFTYRLYRLIEMSRK
ncbi:hypothetical protein PMAYCL1PPCAC_21137, partial [Pristionchus mayeri]